MNAQDTRHGSEPGFTQPAQVPGFATEVTWRKTGKPDEIADRYEVVSMLLEAGVEANRIRVYHDLEDDGVYWVVTLDDERRAVLTDDTEEYVGAMEGPWPFKVVFISPDSVRTEIDDSIDKLKRQIVRWYTEALEPRDDSR